LKFYGVHSAEKGFLNVSIKDFILFISNRIYKDIPKINSNYNQQTKPSFINRINDFLLKDQGSRLHLAKIAKHSCGDCVYQFDQSRQRIQLYACKIFNSTQNIYHAKNTTD
jgi:hypothetical protein